MMSGRIIRYSAILVLGVLALPACAGSSEPAPDAVRVELPEAYELANIILALTDYGRSDPWEVRKDFPYYDEVMSHFAAFVDHPLLSRVNYSRERWREYLSFRTDAIAFAFDDAGKLTRTMEFATHGDLSPFDDNVDLIDDFVEVSSFRSFFADHSDYYRSIIDRYEHYYMIDSTLRFLRESVSPETSGQRHFIAVSPLVYRMNAHRPIDDSTAADFPTLADHLVGKGAGPADPIQRATDLHTLFTEMDHGFVNLISDRYSESIDRAFDYTLWQTDETGYESDLGTFNEYVTWALYDIFIEDHFPTLADRIGLYWHYQNKRRGFLYSGLFASRLRELWRGRPEGARLDDVYPPLLDWTAGVQSTLREPVIQEPADSLAMACGTETALTLAFSEPLATADSFSIILQDGATVLDTLLVSRSRHDLDWSADARSATFKLSIPAVSLPVLAFNWWGASVPLRSQMGVLLRSPSVIQIACT